MNAHEDTVAPASLPFEVRPRRSRTRSWAAARRRCGTGSLSRSLAWLACAGFASTCLAQAPQSPDAIVRGQAFLVEGEVRRPLENAEFDLWCRAGKAWTKQAVRVHDGRFELHLPLRTVWAMPGPIDVGGRAAWTPFGLDGDASSTDPVTMDVHWVKPATLRVLDAGSLEDRADVEIVRIPYLQQGPPSNDSEDTRHVAKAAQSPIELPFFENDPESVFNNHGVVGVETYWVRAPGYAWSRIRVDPFHGGERLVKLWPTTILVDEVSIPRDLQWFVAPVGREGSASRLSVPRGGCMAGLDEGAWALQLRSTDPGGASMSQPLAEARFESARGSTRAFQRDELSALIRRAADARRSASPPNRPRITVLLRLPSFWEPLASEIEIARVDAYGRARGRRETFTASRAVRTPEDVEVLRFDITDVESGPWRVSVDPLAWTGSFEVAPDSPESVAMSVGAPASLRIRVRDAGTDAPLEAEIRAASRPSGFHAVMERSRPMPARDGVHALDVPVGSTRLIVHVEGRPDRYPELPVTPGSNESTLDVHEPIRVEVEARDGEARIPFEQLAVTAESLDSVGEHAGISMSDGLNGYYRMELGRPGRWRFVCHDIQGFSRPDPLELEVRAGTSPRVVFRLTRERERK